MVSYVGLNPHRDTGVEILHTVLLGDDKYAWHKTHTSWSDQQLETLAARLNGLSIDGLSIFPIRGHYMVKYKGALVGKHFKTLQQVCTFTLHGDLYDEKLLHLWRATGELGAMLWYDCIKDMDTYLVCFALSKVFIH